MPVVAEDRGLHRFAVFTACSTLCLIVAGALVTSNDAGLSVPDWPLSYGGLFPPMVGGIRYEHSHRLVAGFVLILLSIMAVLLRRREQRRWVRWVGYSALAAGLGQAVLGGITVLFYLPVAVSTGHACLAQAIFCLTVTLALVTGRRWRQEPRRLADPRQPSMNHLTSISTAAIFVQLLLGAALRHKGFSLTPHLAGAAAVAILVMWTVYRVVSDYAGQPELMRPGAVLGCLLLAQLMLGGGSYWVREITRDAPQPEPIMVWVTVAHVATGALVLASSVWLALESHRLLLHAPASRAHAGKAAIPA